MKATVYGKWVRSVYGSYAAAVVIAIGLNLPWILSARVLPGGWALLGVLVVPAAPLVIFAVMVGLPRRKRLRRITHDLDAMRCPWRLYDLKGAPPVGACPECGAQYTLDGVRRYWPGILQRLKRAKRSGLPAWDRWLLDDCGWR